MVLGIRSKHRRGASVKVEYTVHVQEIRPWPPSESLRSVQKVLLQWENGNQYSGSFLSIAQDSKIVFTESFKLPLILYQDKKSHDKFQKNCLEFSLFVPRKDKAKGQLLGTAMVNLADYGVIESMLSINVPVSLKKSSNNSVQPALVIGLEPVERESSNSSPSVGLSKQTSLDNDIDNMEIASFTDDDASSQSSRTAGSSTYEVGTSSPSEIEKNGYGNAGYDSEKKRKGRLPSTDTSSRTWKQENDNDYISKFRERSMTSVKKNSETPLLRTFPSSISHRDVHVKPNTIVANFLEESASPNSDEVITNSKHKEIENIEQSVEVKSDEGFAPEGIVISAHNRGKNAVKSDSANSLDSHATQENDLREDNEQINDALAYMVNIEEKRELKEMGSDDHEEMTHFPENRLIGNLSEEAIGGQAIVLSEKAPAFPLPSSKRVQHMKSVRKHDAVEGNGLPSENYAGDKELQPEIPYSSQKKGEPSEVIKPKTELPDCRDEWKTEIEMLREELREAAATEVGLYAVVAEHASSANKVHTPARRLSRFYTDACKAGSQAKRASAARAAVSGLVLVSKSCGHDVPRLTFWLSNSIMLRAIVSQTTAEFSNCNRPGGKINGSVSELRRPHKLADSSHVEGEQSTSTDESDDKEDVSTFITALEKVESWLFSRIVESLWWQTFTPHMQPTVATASDISPGSGTKKTCGRRNSLGNHEQGNFSIQLWKKAFKDARERLCPLRAGGHECGCLSVLFRLVMEQLIDRLDMAMFNAILRESADEMPTDPVSDPISESKVLPIPYGESSFGAGVELKNSIGNWSRWLTDLFGLEDDSTDHGSIRGDGKSFKAFRLLHSLSDLMMLPFGMLADPSTRKEVCPLFGPNIIKRVLNSFVPDEFCPDPIPQSIIDALETEVSDASEDILTSFPCTANPTKYTPPAAALLTCVGEVGSQVLKSSRLSSIKKSYNSDDELDELDSSFTSIVPDSFQSSALAKLSSIAREKGGRNVVRYQLLREIWKDDDE
ncbi:EEIG1/EHBP1 protein amino-terminal domain protein [Perilla frutescens var. hirtella]|nr:EEIG1/EHBP1 protein amino-terminal domain protein [Perilla frutescens var. hirtella]